MQTQNAGQNSKQTYKKTNANRGCTYTDNDTMQEQDKMAKDFSKRHYQAFKANIEKRKQIQTQIAVIHNV